MNLLFPHSRRPRRGTLETFVIVGICIALALLFALLALHLDHKYAAKHIAEKPAVICPAKNSVSVLVAPVAPVVAPTPKPAKNTTTVIAPKTVVTVVTPTPPTPKPAPAPQTFDWAVAQAVSSGQSGIALITASWCGACKRLERDILPKLRESGDFDPPYICVLDADKDKAEVQSLMGKEKYSLPAWVRFTASEDGDQVKVKPVERLSGLKPAAALTAFLKGPPPKPCAPADAKPAAKKPEPKLLQRLFAPR